MLVIKNVLFVLVLIYASYCDIKTRIIPDKVHVMIILLGFIQVNWLDSILGMLLVPLSFFAVALLKEGSMGGGDIKLVGACSFFLGFSSGMVGSLIGLIVAISMSIVYFSHNNIEYSCKFALIPYLGLGYLCISLIKILV